VNDQQRTADTAQKIETLGLPAPQVRIIAPALLALKAAVIRAYPFEGCGVLIGTESATGMLDVLSAIETRNAETIRGADRFVINARDYLSIENDLRIRGDGSRVVGFFHGHPDAPAIPSRVDLEMARGLFDVARTFYLYAIAEVRGAVIGGVTAWRLSADLSRFEAVPWQ
jgi:proteasome lid subunit RPN8/RPN11